MGRIAGWEAALVDLLRQASMRGFSARRRWNCGRFGHACAEALSGRRITIRWQGTLEATVDATLPRIAPREAVRGDLVLALVPKPALGVCVGRSAVFVAARGLLSVPMHRISAAWRV